MPTGSHNGHSEQIAVRLPLDVAAEMKLRAVQAGSSGKAIVAALRKAWNLSPPNSTVPQSIVQPKSEVEPFFRVSKPKKGRRTRPRPKPDVTPARDHRTP